jgi:hypothetical protein
MVVYPLVFRVGAAPALVAQVTASEDQVMVYAVPSSTIRVIDCPAFHVPAVGVELPVSVHVWMEPFAGDKAGVVPDTAKTSSV